MLSIQRIKSMAQSVNELLFLRSFFCYLFLYCFFCHRSATTFRFTNHLYLLEKFAVNKLCDKIRKKYAKIMKRKLYDSEFL